MDKNERLESEKSQLEYRIQVADQMVSALNLRESEQKNRLFELKRDIARLEKKETEFRDIIISNVATQQVTDQDVIQAFSELRQTVQQLAKNQAFDLIQNPLLPTPDAKNQANKHFYTIIRDLSPKDVSFRVRMRIWEILYRFIFSRTIFGLKGDYDHDKESQDMWDIETHLVRFEEYLSKNSKGLIADSTNLRPLTCPLVKDSMVSNWRIYTLQCIGAMEIPERLSDYVADKLEVCFMPLISKRATNEQKDELWDKMLDVCRKAVAVKLMMQRSKEGYNITTIDLKDHPLYSKTGHLAESMGVEGGKTPDASDSIAYVLFGALMKHPMNNGGENKVLLKAEIILKKMSRV